jgi:hypothetical protein
MQTVLDDYLKDYNARPPHQGRGMPKISNTAVNSQTKNAKLKVA